MTAQLMMRGSCAIFLAAAGMPVFFDLAIQSEMESLSSALRTHAGTWVIAQFSIASFCMLIIWRLHSHTKSDRSAILWILATGVLTRLILIPVYPYASNDIERYLWDGRVALEGLDPYRITPDAPEVEHLRTDWATPPEHSHLPTLYPPAALLLFATSAMAGPSLAWFVWKVLLAIASLATLAVSLALLQRFDRQKHIALVALSPLLVFEISLGAHLDGWTTLAIAAALYAATTNRPAWAGTLLGLGTLIKLLPLLAIPAFVIAWGLSRKTLRLMAAAAGTTAAGYLIASSIGLQPLGSTAHFFANWRFGSPVFALIDHPSQLIQALGCVIALGIATWLGRKSLHKRELVTSLQATLAFPLLITPVLFPWYLTVLVPLIAAEPTGFLIAWTLLAPTTYEVLNEFLGKGVWEPASWPLMLIATGCVLGLLWDRSRQSIEAYSMD